MLTSRKCKWRGASSDVLRAAEVWFCSPVPVLQDAQLTKREISQAEPVCICQQRECYIVATGLPEDECLWIRDVERVRAQLAWLMSKGLMMPDGLIRSFSFQA